MNKVIAIEVDEETYAFLQSKVNADESIEMIALDYLQEGINLERTLRQ